MKPTLLMIEGAEERKCGPKRLGDRLGQPTGMFYTGFRVGKGGGGDGGGTKCGCSGERT